MSRGTVINIFSNELPDLIKNKNRLFPLKKVDSGGRAPDRGRRGSHRHIQTELDRIRQIERRHLCDRVTDSY